MKKAIIFAQLLGVFVLCTVLSSCGGEILEPPSLTLDEEKPDPSLPSSWSEDNTFDPEDEIAFRKAAERARQVYSTKKSKAIYPETYRHASPDHRSIMWRLKRLLREKIPGGGCAEEPDSPCLK